MRRGEHKGRQTPGELYEFGRVVDSRGTSVTVRRSGSAHGAFVWLFTRDYEGREVVDCEVALGGKTGVSPHLSRADARRLAEALLRFADGAE